MALQAIPSTSIRHAVADGIRGALREGLLQPGEDLNEALLAEKFEVSRGPLREALLVLVEEGLMVHSRNRGFSVVRFTKEDKDHITEVRLLLESRALERARDRATPDSLRRLAELKEELLLRFENDGDRARDAAEIAFHSFIWDLGGNPWLVSYLKRAMIPYFTFGVHLGYAPLDLGRRQADEMHQLYIDYLAGKTTCSAAECVGRHLRLL